MISLRTLVFCALLMGPVRAENDSIALLVKTAQESTNPVIRTALLKGMLKGLEGQRNVPTPKGWDALGTELMASNVPEHQSLARELGQIFGDQAATESALELLRNQKARPADRRVALKSLLAQKNTGLIDELNSLLQQPNMRIAAIRAFGKVPGAGADPLLKRYSTFDTQAQRAVVETLATRKNLAESLFNAMEQGVVKTKEIPAYLAQPLTSLLGKRFTKVYGEPRQQTTTKAKLIEKYSAMLDQPEATKADPAHGRVVYSKLCGTCHQMYGEGGILGPDLTGSNRANREYILLNIVDPNFDVPDGYKMVVLKTNTNQVLAGTIGEEDNQKVVLKTVSGNEVISKEDIKERQILPLSMMPEGMLETMPPRDFYALIKYLQTDKQTDKP